MQTSGEMRRENAKLVQSSCDRGEARAIQDRQQHVDALNGYARRSHAPPSAGPDDTRRSHCP